MQKKKGTMLSGKNRCVICLQLGILLLSLLIISSCAVDEIPKYGDYSIKGRVTTLSDGNEIIGLEGVRVTIEGSGRHTVTDGNGYYSINNVPGTTVSLKAEKGSYICIPEFDALETYNGASFNVTDSAVNTVVEKVDFTATDKLTIAQIQGRSHISPLENVRVEDVEGIITSVTLVRAHYKFDENQFDGSVKDQIIGEDGFYMQMVTPDGDPLTSDGIFVSTRDINGPYNRSAWRKDCLIKTTNSYGDVVTRYPVPGDIVKVSGIVREFRPVSRFNDSTGYNTRTQIEATSLEYVDTKNITDENCVLITYSEQPSISNKDKYRVLNFNEEGMNQLGKACDLFESVEGMLVRVDEPIVVGSTYYNLTGIMADGGKRGTEYSETFNEKWMAPVIRENNYNAGLIHVYYEKSDTDVSLGALPQIGTILTADNGDHVLRGCMDYSTDGNYIIYPLRYEKSNKSPEVNGINIRYTNVKFSRHDKYRFVVNDAPNSFYSSNSELAALATEDFAADGYQAILLNSSKNADFAVPWGKDPASDDPELMRVAVFNLENYSDMGLNYSKKEHIADAIVNNLHCPDLLYVVEMGDDHHSGILRPDDHPNFDEMPEEDKEITDNIIYENQDGSWLAPTGYVSARKNYETLIQYISDTYGVEYDYRQIDPIEFDQAGSPGNNIRVGFMFRKDRISAIDAGMPTNYMNHVVFEDKKGVVEDYQYTLSKQNAIPYKSPEGKLRLTQSPGFIQHPDFYHSRIPLACQFVFKPTNEEFVAIACHLYAKGGDAPLYGSQQPPVFGSNNRRGNQTKVINDYIHELKKLDSNVKIIVAGDMNDFGFTRPIKELTGEIINEKVLYSLSDAMPLNERFTYTFRGNLQQLDHIFVTENIYDDIESDMAGMEWKYKVFIPHIDSLFSRNNHIQISDHDPIAARVSMKKTNTEI